ncbi:MAG: glycosyltransferase [Clostridiaceae bacterium]|nr:glycosyltransferase [Clostridiaceae bacterium]
MKKILYIVNCGFLPDEKGIINKINQEKWSFEKAGYEVKIYNINKSDLFFNELEVINKGRIKKTFKVVNNIMEFVQREKPDFIYIRDILYYFNLYPRLSKIAPVFVEIQTNILEEFKLYNKKRYFVENYFKRSYFKNISAFICITKEIYKNESQYNKKQGFILGNGIDVSEIEFVPLKKENNKINLIFIGSHQLPWHGVERLLDSFLKAENKDKFQLHIVGYENILGEEHEDIKFYGFIKDKKSMEEVFARCDIGIGTMSLYKKNMNEAAPLKTRHYLAKGLPVVIGYEDVDIDDQLPFVLRVANDSSLLDFKSIERFYQGTKELRLDKTITEYALNNISWEKKVKKLSEFMEGFEVLQ